MISRTYCVLHVLPYIVAVTLAAGQTSAPPLTPEQLQRLHKVKAWDIDYTYDYRVDAQRSGDLSGKCCYIYGGYNITTWNSAWTQRESYHAALTTAGKVRQSDCGTGSDSCLAVYQYPALVDQVVDTRTVHADANMYKVPSDTLFGAQRAEGSFAASGSKVYDGTAGHGISGNFQINYSVNPPAATIYFWVPGFSGNETAVNVGVGRNDSISFVTTLNAYYDIYAAPYDSFNAGTTGDTYIRVENGRFVIHGSGQEADTLTGCNFPFAACDSNTNMPFRYATASSWSIREHPDSSYDVVRPAAGERWITTTRDTIVWHSADSGTVNIFYSPDSGRTYTPIAANFAGGDSQHYIWKVPKGLLSRKASIKVESAADTNRSGESGLFRIKGYELTRVTPAGDYETFTPGTHGWSFANASANLWSGSEYVIYLYETDSTTGRQYPRTFLDAPIDASAEDFPSWPLFVQTFGVNACYFDSAGGRLLYRPSAVEVWSGMKGRWHGSCEGLAISSAGAFGDKPSLLQSFPQLGSFGNLIEAPTTYARRKVVNEIYLTQFGKAQKAYEALHVNAVVDQAWLDDLKNIFTEDARADGIDLCMYTNTRSSGHVVTPYRVEQDTSLSDTVKIFVYDNNHPADAQRYIRLTKLPGGFYWFYEGFQGTSHLYTEPVSLYMQGALFPGAGRPPQAPSPRAAAPPLTLYATPGAAIRITGATGDSIGYADSAAFGTIPGGVPIIPRTGFFQPPIGFTVPSGSYEIGMTGFADSSSSCMIVGDSMIYAYSRRDAAPGQRDELLFDGGLQARGSDGATKNIYLGGVIAEGDHENLFGAANVPLGPADTAGIVSSDRSAVRFSNRGSAKSYTLQLHRVSAAGDVAFEHAGITLGANATHEIIPLWDSLDHAPVRILIDEGNDGTIDDSLLVNNEATAAPDDARTGLPRSFVLFPNYPNPFNPVTRISYALPGRMHVSLHVVNVLGEVIATLVDEDEPAGVRSVTFDASRLPSGVYFYTLRAGPFVETRKMLLMR